MTMVEVLVASSILAMTLAGFMVVFRQHRGSVYRIESSVSSMRTARGQMEHLRTLPYSHPELDTGTHDFTGGVYIISGGSDLKDIEVTAYYYDSSRFTTGSVTLVTTIFKDMH